MSLLDCASEAKLLARDLVADERGPHVATREELAAVLVLISKIAEEANKAIDRIAPNE